MAQAEKIFPDLSGEELEHQTTVIESCCMNCFENVSITIIHCVLNVYCVWFVEWKCSHSLILLFNYALFVCCRAKHDCC